METLDMIQARKAIRTYTGPVNELQLQRILAAANDSPVGMGNYRDYRLTVIQDPKILAQLAGIYHAPVVIVISAQEITPMELLSVGTIAHNIELAAEDQGIGANYNLICLDSIPTEVLPAGFKPAFAVTLGQTNEPFKQRQRAKNRIKVNFVN